MCIPLRIFSPAQPRRLLHPPALSLPRQPLRPRMRHSQDEHLLAAAHFRYSLTHHF